MIVACSLGEHPHSDQRPTPAYRSAGINRTLGHLAEAVEQMPDDSLLAEHEAEHGALGIHRRGGRSARTPVVEALAGRSRRVMRAWLSHAERLSASGRLNSLGEQLRRRLDLFCRIVDPIEALQHPIVQHRQLRGMIEHATQGVRPSSTVQTALSWRQILSVLG
ncbi:hypothetical protein NKJ26_20350 [Mesorhizobium sp. M0152]|uniref:hypothetical protein n=1 Tax=Mesorhizobium sp. M0152 TaxID=2956898 RepID=UPI003338DF19